MEVQKMTVSQALKNYRKIKEIEEETFPERKSYPGCDRPGEIAKKTGVANSIMLEQVMENQALMNKTLLNIEKKVGAEPQSEVELV